MTSLNHTSQPGEDRQIRVFISSTFRDMQEERDILIKKIFPQLRKLCEERAVTWTEVDLRWGITTEQAAEGKVLPLCLEEIHRCRPYFIGLLGERYGWVLEPDSIPGELLESQPWLKQHLDHSVTELEILYGVFSEAPMHGHAYFYFRDPRYLESIPLEKRQDFTAESPDAAGKLEKLKQKIRGARDEQVCDLRENYATPEQLGEWILEDFTKLIDHLYLKDQTPNPLDQEAARHEAYARSRRLAFVGREDLLRRLTEHCATPGKPLVLTGESGCGKSALLAEWVARWRKVHSDDLFIQHYIGSTPDSADWQGLVRRILSELKRAFAITDEIPVQPDALRGALNDWTVKAAGSRRVVLVLDALNQLAEDGAVRQLDWLPVAFPANFRLLISSLPGESLDALHKRGWPEMNVPLFARADIGPSALAYFKIFSKTPSLDLVAKLESTLAACNALYLRAVLDELRQFGIYETLQAKAADYLSAPDLPDLFDRILTRWHDDFGKDPEHSDLVRRSLCIIACARFGLSEAEVLDLLGKRNSNGEIEPLPRRSWAPFYLATENALALRTGLLNFGHDYLCAAVRKRWLGEAETVRAFRLQLVAYFGKVAEPTNRKLDELPTLLCELAQWEKLKDLLADIPTFLRLRETERWKVELHGFWIPLRQRYDAGDVYRKALAAYEISGPQQESLSFVLVSLGLFNHEAADHKSAESLYRRALAIDERELGPDHPDVAVPLNNLSALLLRTDRLSEAETLLRRSLHILERHLGSSHPEVATRLNNLGELLRTTNRPLEAEPLYRRALAVDEDAFGSEHPSVATDLNNLSLVLQAAGRMTEAETLLRRALAIDEHVFGRNHPKVAIRANNLAALMQAAGRLVEAEPLYRQALGIWETNFGNDHPHVASALCNLAVLFKTTNRMAQAEPLLRRALNIDEHAFGQNHTSVAIRLGHLAELLRVTNRAAEAEPLFRRALAINESIFGPNHLYVVPDLSNLGALLWTARRFAECESLCRRVLAINEQSLGPDDPKVAVSLNNLAQLLQGTHRLAESKTMMHRMLRILFKNTVTTQREHPHLRSMISNFANLLQQMGHSPSEVQKELVTLARPFGIQFGGDG